MSWQVKLCKANWPLTDPNEILWWLHPMVPADMLCLLAYCLRKWSPVAVRQDVRVIASSSLTIQEYVNKNVCGTQTIWSLILSEIVWKRTLRGLNLKNTSWKKSPNPPVPYYSSWGGGGGKAVCAQGCIFHNLAIHFMFMMIWCISEYHM